MSTCKEIVLASTVKAFAPVELYVITNREGAEFGRTFDFDAACQRMRGLVSTLNDYSVRVDSRRFIRYC